MRWKQHRHKWRVGAEVEEDGVFGGPVWYGSVGKYGEEEVEKLLEDTSPAVGEEAEAMTGVKEKRPGYSRRP